MHSGALYLRLCEHNDLKNTQKYLGTTTPAHIIRSHSNSRMIVLIEWNMHILSGTGHHSDFVPVADATPSVARQSYECTSSAISVPHGAERN